jgi:hypothetical protein
MTDVAGDSSWHDLPTSGITSVARIVPHCQNQFNDFLLFLSSTLERFSIVYAVSLCGSWVSPCYPRPSFTRIAAGASSTSITIICINLKEYSILWQAYIVKEQPICHRCPPYQRCPANTSVKSPDRSPP